MKVRRGRGGGEHRKLLLADRTGSGPAVLREGTADAQELCGVGKVVHVIGTCVVDGHHGQQLVVEAVRAAAEDEYAPEELIAGPTRAAAQMETDLRGLLATVQSPHLRRLLAAVFGEGSATWARFREAPAAKHYHQAYPHGLLEHSLTVAQAVSSISATFPGIDRDVAVTGALLHDIGKLEAYKFQGG